MSGVKRVLIEKNHPIFLFLLAHCATAHMEVIDISISNSGFQIGCEFYSSRQALAAALVTKNVKFVHFLPDRNASYKQVEQALKAAKDANVDIGMVGNIQGWPFHPIS